MRRAFLLLPLLALGACAGSADGRGITVFAAASLSAPFEALADELDDGAAPTFSFAGSSALVRQIEQGAPADVVATADERSMQALVSAGLVEEPRVFARNRLAIAVEPGNPQRIEELADLARPDLVVVLCEPTVPAGAYAREALAKAGVTVRPRSLELDVKAALAKVTAGEADAAIVYASDTEDRVEIPGEHNVVAAYPIAVVAGSPRTESARRFVDAVLGRPGREALAGAGFLPPG